jgi:hypothetical protein
LNIGGSGTFCAETLLLAEDVPHATDLGAYATELFFDALIATVDVVDAVEDRLAIGDESGQDERSGGAEVGAHDGRGLEGRLATDRGCTALHGDVGSHAVELADVHETVLEDVFCDDGGAFCLCGEGHVLGLHVGGETGILLGRDVGGLEFSGTGADANLVLADIELDAALLQLGDEGTEVRGVAAVDVEVAACDGSCDEEGSCLDAVGIDAVACAVEASDALYLDGGGSRAFDLRAHGDKQGGEIGHLGLARAVLEDGLAVGQYGGHEEVFGAGDGDLVEDDVRAFEAVGFGFEVAVVVGDDGAHGFEALDVEVDGASADGASAGHGDAGHARTRDEWPEHERTGAHGLDDLVLGDGVGQDAALDACTVLGAAVAELDLGAHGGEQLALGLNIADLRDVFEDNLVFGEDGGGHAGKGGVLGPGNFDGPKKGVSAAYNKLVHDPSLRKSYEENGWLG